MSIGSRIASLGRTLFRSRHLDADLDAEVRAYLEELTRRKTAAGLAPEEARRGATLEMGGIEAVKESARAVRFGIGFETTVRDLRYAARGLRRSPGFATAAILTLALGIGANTAIFSVVDAMLLSPLPYRDSGRLVFVWSDMSAAGYPRAPLSGPELADLRRRATQFSGFGAIWATSAALNGDGDPEQVRIGRVTPDFFPVLGASAALGRTFEATDEDGDDGRVLLSDALWRRRYGADRGIVGRRILLGGRPTTVVGVMPASFRLLLPPDAAVPDDLEAWVPFWPQMTERHRGQQFLRVVGRLKPGVVLDQGRREVESIASAISSEFSEYGSAGRRYLTVGLRDDGNREIRPTLLALFGGVGILLGITCVNVAGLLVARAAARRSEISLRVALGAGRARLLRQFLAEGLLLAALGAVAGLAVARLTLTMLQAARPESLHRIASARIDPQVLLFTAGTALFWGVLLSLAPLAEVLKSQPVAGLRRDRSASRSRLRTAFVAVQIALGVVLVVCAGLVARTFLRLQSVDPGYRTDHVLSFRLGLPDGRYGDPEAFNAFSRRFEKELCGLPGVVAAAAVSHLPFDHIPNWGGPYLTKAGEDESEAPMADYRAVSPGFFAAVGARLTSGRDFDEADDPRGQPVVIVDERLALRTWGNEGAVGKRLALDPDSSGHPHQEAVVVGVVRHLRQRSLTEEVREQIYFPQRQIQRNPAAYVVRARTDPSSLAGPIRGILARMDPQLPLAETRPLDDYVTAARGSQRFMMILAAAFASVALVLAGAGLYGVVAYSVARRRKEFGIRLAVGALPRQIRGLVVRESLGVVAAGLVLGVPAAAFAALLLRAQLFGVTPRDAASYLIAVAVLGVGALAAAAFAARRATGSRPLEALRAD